MHITLYISHLLTFLRVQHLHGRLIRRVEFGEEGGRDGEQVTSCKTEDLVGIPEGSPHDDSLVVKLLVVVVDFGDALYTWSTEYYTYILQVYTV